MPDGTIATPNPAGDIQSWVNLLGSIFGTTGNTNSNTTSPEGLAAGSSLLPILMQMLTSSDFSPEAAERDSQPAVQLILKQLMESGIPQISGQEGSAGAYNSTTSALLKNDLAARGAAEGASLIAKNKATYGALRTGQANSLIGLINSIINANRQTQTTTTTPNVASNTAARNAALAGLAAGAARNLTKPPPPGGIAKPGSKPKPIDNVADPDDLPPEMLMNIQNPDRLPNFDSVDQEPDDGGPTPEVTVSNTGNDTPDMAITDQGLGDLMNLGDLGSDLGNLENPDPDSGAGNTDWSWLIPDNPDQTPPDPDNLDLGGGDGLGGGLPDGGGGDGDPFPEE